MKCGASHITGRSLRSASCTSPSTRISRCSRAGEAYQSRPRSSRLRPSQRKCSRASRSRARRPSPESRARGCAARPCAARPPGASRRPRRGRRPPGRRAAASGAARAGPAGDANPTGAMPSVVAADGGSAPDRRAAEYCAPGLGPGAPVRAASRSGAGCRADIRMRFGPSTAIELTDGSSAIDVAEHGGLADARGISRVLLSVAGVVDRRGRRSSRGSSSHVVEQPGRVGGERGDSQPRPGRGEPCSPSCRRARRCRTSARSPVGEPERAVGREGDLVGS